MMSGVCHVLLASALLDLHCGHYSLFEPVIVTIPSKVKFPRTMTSKGVKVQSKVTFDKPVTGFFALLQGGTSCFARRAMNVHWQHRHQLYKLIQIQAWFESHERYIMHSKKTTEESS